VVVGGNADAALVIAVVILAMTVVLVLMSSGIKVLRPYERAYYFRGRRFVRMLDPGITFVVPILGRISKIDMRDKTVRWPYEWDDLHTDDEGALALTLTVVYRIVNPEKTMFTDLLARGVSGDYQYQMYEIFGNALHKSALSIGLKEVHTNPQRVADRVVREVKTDVEKLGLSVSEARIEFGQVFPTPSKPQPAVSSTIRKGV
jgi:regulator of protease activity HflC (stomatin/prohibitin superfamily)